MGESDPQPAVDCPSPSKTEFQGIASQGGGFGLPFLELSRATGKLSQEGRGRQRREQPQRQQRQSESRLLDTEPPL